MSASQSAEIGLPEALERAASALPALADAIRPANGDPDQLANVLGDDDARAVLAWLLEHESGAGGELALPWASRPSGPIRLQSGLAIGSSIGNAYPQRKIDAFKPCEQANKFH
jgi:hypothetical protein